MSAAVFVLALVSVSCGSDEDTGDGGAQDPTSLQGKSWIVTEILDQEGNTQIVDIGIDAMFDGSTITGDASCNSYLGGTTRPSPRCR